MNPDVRTAQTPTIENNDSMETMQINGEICSLRYLPLGRTNIRLISISPLLNDGKLNVNMIEAPLNDQLEFHVLSYVWGDSAHKKTVFVNGQQLGITQNLCDFLESVRNPIIHLYLREPTLETYPYHNDIYVDKNPLPNQGKASTCSNNLSSRTKSACIQNYFRLPFSGAALRFLLPLRGAACGCDISLIISHLR